MCLLFLQQGEYKEKKKKSRDELEQNPDWMSYGPGASALGTCRLWRASSSQDNPENSLRIIHSQQTARGPEAQAA